MKKTLVLITILLFNCQYLYAQGEFCQTLDKTAVYSNRKKFQYSSKNPVLFEDIAFGRKVQITRKDVVENFFDVRPAAGAANGALAQKEMMLTAIESLLFQQVTFTRVYPDLQLRNYADIKSCLNEKSIKFNEVIDQLQNNVTGIAEDARQKFFFTLYTQGLMARAMLAKIESYKQERLDQINHIRRTRMHFDKGRQLYQDDIDALDDLYKERIETIENSLLDIMRESPILFKTDTTHSAFDWFETKIEMSELYHKMMKFIPHNVDQGLTSLISMESNTHQMNSFFEQNFNTLNNTFINNYIDPGFEKIALEEIQEHIYKLEEAAINICQNEGKYLHHFPILKNKIYKQQLYKKNPKQQMLKRMAGVCYLQKTKPLRPINDFTWKTGLGMAAIGLGAASQFIPLVGNFAGAVLMIGGDIILISERVVDSVHAYDQYKTHEQLYAGQFQTPEKYVEAKDSYYDAVSDSLLNSFLLLPSFWVLKNPDKFPHGKTNPIKRVEENKSHFDMMDPDKYVEFIMNKDKADPLNFLFDKTRVRRHKLQSALMEKNDPHSIYPALIKWGRVKDKDKLGMILNVVNEKGSLKDIEHAYEMLDTLYMDYINIHKKLTEKVREGMSKARQIEVLKQVDENMKWTDFYLHQEKLADLKLPYYRTDGSIGEFTPKFSHQRELKALVDELEHEVDEIFALTTKREVSRKSSIYDIIDNHAETNEIMRIVLNKLSTKNPQSLSPNQFKLLNKFESALNNVHLYPRLDAIIVREKRKLWAEVLDIVTFKFVKGMIRRNALFDITKIAPEYSFKVSPIKTMVKGFLWVSIGSGVFYSVDQFFREGELGEIRAHFNNALNVNIRSVFESTNEEKKCAKEFVGRTFGSCYYRLLANYLGVELAYKAVTPDYPLARDVIVQEKVKEYTRFLLEIRRKYAYGDVVVLGDEQIKNIGTEIAIEDIIYLVNIIFPDEKDAQRITYALLTAKTQQEKDEILQVILDRYGQEFKDIMRKAAEADLSESIKQRGRIPLTIERELYNLIKLVKSDPQFENFQVVSPEELEL